MGSGLQPAQRPSSTTGGAIVECVITSAGRPAPIRPPLTWTTLSAYCRTRSTRCSAITTVTARPCTSRATAATPPAAAGGVRPPRVRGAPPPPGRGGGEPRRRLVEHQPPGGGGEARADRDPL